MNLLVIEDDQTLLEMYVEILKSKHQVKSYDNPKDAFKYYVNNPFEFDLIMVDHGLPGRNGKSLIFDIKAVNPKQRIVVISGDCDAIQLPAKFGIKKYSKPLPMGTLLRIVDEAFLDEVVGFG
jgi:DNA-binding NtrC family response regulator